MALAVASSAGGTSRHPPHPATFHCIFRPAVYPAAMLQFGVSTDKGRALLERMARLGIRESDLEENFVKGSGAGGQKVNKTSSCVWLRHKPSGIEVKCQWERSQALNRFL